MVARFPAMIGLINNGVKVGASFCECPANKLCINFLRLLRNHGYIWGFHYVSPKKRLNRLYPRVKIMLKYIDNNTPIIKAIQPYKNTSSNFHLIHTNNFYKILTNNKYYILTSTFGLSLTSLTEMYLNRIKSTNPHYAGKILAVIFI